MSSPKKNTTYVFYIVLFDSVNGGFKVNPTIAAGDFQRSIGGAAYANLATLPVVEPAGSISVKMSLSAAEMNASNGKTMISIIDVAGNEWDNAFVLIEYDVSIIDNVIALLPTALVGGRMDVSVGALNGDVVAALNLAASAGVIMRGSAVAGTLTTTQMTTDLTEVTNKHFNGRVVIWTSGTLFGQQTAITGYNNGLITYTTVTEAPLDGDEFVVV